MTNVQLDGPANSLRQRMIEDMNMPRFTRKTQFDYVRHVARFATYLGRPPDTATVEGLRQFQLEQREAGIGIPTMNSFVSALRFFFAHTIDRPNLSRKLYMVKNPRSLPVVLSRDEVAPTRRDQLPEAQGCTVRCVWRWFARRRELPHRRAGRSCRGLRRLWALADRLQLLPQPALPQATRHGGAPLASRSRGRSIAGWLLPRRLHAARRRHRAGRHALDVVAPGLTVTVDCR